MTILTEINDILDAAQSLGLTRVADEHKARLLHCQGKDMSQCRIVVAGLYNSGKSSLLNALCNSLAVPYIFAMGDIPTTKHFAEQEYDGCIYVDTPGYGENESEREKAALEWETASVIIFVRSLVNNTQQREDFEELKHICRVLDSPQERILVALSKSGQVEADIIRESIAETCKYIKDETGYELTVVSMDSHDYMEGKRNGEEDMAAQSGVEDIRAWIEKRKYLRCTYLTHAIVSLADLKQPLLVKKEQVEQSLCNLEKKQSNFLVSLKSAVCVAYQNILAPVWEEVFFCEKKVKKMQHNICL